MSQEYICDNQLKYKRAPSRFKDHNNFRAADHHPPTNQSWINLSRSKVGYGYISLALSRSQTVSIYWTAEVGIGTAGVADVGGRELDVLLCGTTLEESVMDSSYCGGGASSSAI